MVPGQVADDDKDDGVDGGRQHGRLAGHEEPLGPRRDGQKNTGRQKKEQKATEEVIVEHLYLDAV